MYLVQALVSSRLSDLQFSSGTVGLSLGYPGLNCSLSGAFTTFSKLVIIAMEVSSPEPPIGIEWC